MIKCGHRKLARSYLRYIHDLIVFNNKKFQEYVKGIYASQLNTEKTNQSYNLASYSFLDLIFIIEKDGKLSTKLFDKRGDCNFHIVTFPFL